MADINAYLREAINGPAPQHKVAGRNQFEISEGSDGATHTKIVDVDGNPLNSVPVEDKAVKAELAEIKRTQAEILERLDGTFDTQLTGSIVELLDDELEVPNANNMFIGASTSTAASTGRGLLIENFKGISLYIRNNTDDDFVINNLYQGTSETPGSVSGRRRYYFDFGITVTSGSRFSVDFRDPDDDLNNIQHYLKTYYPYLVFSIFNGDGLGDGTVDVTIIGIR